MELVFVLLIIFVVVGFVVGLYLVFCVVWMDFIEVLWYE